MECASLIVNIFIAIGTITVAVIAIWGEWIRSKIYPTKLKIVPHNLEGNLTKFANGKRVIFYHLGINNTRLWRTVKNCRVNLVKISKKGPDGEFQPIKLVVPQQYVWAPAELTPPSVNIVKKQILDFGRLIEGNDKFEPLLYGIPNNFEGFVKQGDVIRFHLEISAEDYVSRNNYIFEVAWNGKWNSNLQTMKHNLVIKER